MKGYVYLDNDYNINVRLASYIDVEDPQFWARNAHMIDTVWKFDTDDEQQMYRVLSAFRTKELPAESVINFCKAIKFDLPTFMAKYSTKTIKTNDNNL